MCEVESSIPELSLSHSREPADQNGFSTRRGAQSSLCKKVKEKILYLHSFRCSLPRETLSHPSMVWDVRWIFSV